MQVKIIIGTIAFMLTMIILGFVALGEPARLQEFSGAIEGRSVENGAEIFLNNCATCHGVNGRAEECLDPATGEPTDCIGLPLNHEDLLCGNPPPRLVAQDWQGTTLDYIRSTVTSGRPWNGMPTWGQQFGGPLQQNQVEDVSQFVLNWSSPELCEGVVEDGADAEEWPTQVSELPAGDAASGAQLYQSLGCQGCHGSLDDEGSASLGPWLGGIDAEAGQRRDGYTAADYVYESILHPNAFIAPDCPTGPCTAPSAMPPNFGERMTLQDMADILALLLGTDTFESEAEVVYPPEE